MCCFPSLFCPQITGQLSMANICDIGMFWRVNLPLMLLMIFRSNLSSPNPRRRDSRNHATMCRTFYSGCNARIVDATVRTAPRSKRQSATGIVNHLYHREDANNDTGTTDGTCGTDVRNSLPLLLDDHPKTLIPTKQ